MNEAIAQDLEAITEAITATVKPVAIYLFGSYAYGTPRKDSDIDIYVVVPDSVTNTHELNAEIELAMFGKPIRDVDLMLTRQSAFDRKKESYFLEKKIYHKGIKLYGK